MFLERSGLFNSAGFGISYQGLLGGRLRGEYKERVPQNSPGKYGNFAFGLYNGGGYHQFERNLSKKFEIRVTLRPFSSAIPSLQFSYLGIFGEGNISQNPYFKLNTGTITYESRYLTATAQDEKELGNSYGSYVDSNYLALPHHAIRFTAKQKSQKQHLPFLAVTTTLS